MRFDVLVWKSAQTRCQLARGRAGRGGEVSQDNRHTVKWRGREASLQSSAVDWKKCVCVWGGGGGGGYC